MNKPSLLWGGRFRTVAEQLAHLRRTLDDQREWASRYDGPRGRR